MTTLQSGPYANTSGMAAAFANYVSTVYFPYNLIKYNQYSIIYGDENSNKSKSFIASNMKDRYTEFTLYFNQTWTGVMEPRR